VIRAVLDTNVLAAGLARLDSPTSASGIILDLWLAGVGAGPFELIVSSHILEELERVLAKPYFRAGGLRSRIASVQSFIESVATIAAPDEIVSGVASHPEDDLVLSAAESAQADYRVTGDKRFLAVGSHGGVVILSPRAFLDILNAAENR
jgi:putative PIN family toxin of toxin-antitoxin system